MKTIEKIIIIALIAGIAIIGLNLLSVYDPFTFGGLDWTYKHADLKSTSKQPEFTLTEQSIMLECESSDIDSCSADVYFTIPKDTKKIEFYWTLQASANADGWIFITPDTGIRGQVITRWVSYDYPNTNGRSDNIVIEKQDNEWVAVIDSEVKPIDYEDIIGKVILIKTGASGASQSSSLQITNFNIEYESDEIPEDEIPDEKPEDEPEQETGIVGRVIGVPVQIAGTAISTIGNYIQNFINWLIGLF